MVVKSERSNTSASAGAGGDGTNSGAPAPLPNSFRLSRFSIAKESHKQPIYCASWSTDVFVKEESSPICGSEADDISATADATATAPAVDSIDRRDSSTSTASTGNDETTTTASSDVSSGIGKNGAPFRCLATCGGNHVTVYETAFGAGLSLRQAYQDADEDEVFYVCAFGGRGLGTQAGYAPVGTMKEEDGGKGSTIILNSDTDSSDDEQTGEKPAEKRRKLLQTLIDLSKFDGPQLLLAAGRRGIVKVIDTVRRSLILTLSGHGDEIYDMKFSPTNEWLLLTASKDESLRLWNVQSGTCIANFAGHEGHRDAVLTCAWHPLGMRFASGGMDNSVKIWSLDSDGMSRAIEESYTVRPQRKLGLDSFKSAESSTNVSSSQRPKTFRTMHEQMPIFSTSKIHLDYCDCVQFVGDLVLSKSISDVVVLWKPILTDADSESMIHMPKNYPGDKKPTVPRISNEVFALREFILKKCDIWFIRFQTDPDCRMLAVGNNIGEIKIWDLSSANPYKKHFVKVDHQHCASPIRMVSFCPDGRSLVAACDDSSVWKWDGQNA